MGACGLSCNAGYANCNGASGDGCEVNTSNDAANCGGCGNACPARANASRTCSMSSCGFACTDGFGNCNGSDADGCEQRLDVAGNCGACGASPAEVCDGLDNDCDGLIDEGLRAQWLMGVRTTELQMLNIDCTVGAESSIACRNAANAYCAGRAGLCSPNGIGPALASPGLNNILCVQGSFRTTWPFSRLTMVEPACVPAMPDMIACNRALSVLCEMMGYVGGAGVDANPAGVTGVCFDPARAVRVAMRYSTLRMYSARCDGVMERIGANCTQAINLQCQMLGLGTGGFGPITSVGDDLTAYCVRP